MIVAVEGIGLLGRGLAGWKASREVLAGRQPYHPSAVADPGASFLPPNERRRSTDRVRWAVHVAQEAIEQSGLDPRDVPTIFASSGGEMGVFDQLCRVLATGEQHMSPTLFHQSVHNTAAGYWGIATTSQESSTALSCYDDSFAAGLMESAAMVCAEQRPVLLVAYDLPVPAPLYQVRPISEGFAVAFVLAPKPGRALVTIGLRLEQGAAVKSAPLPDQALERLRLNNPAARSLPLLCVMAAALSQTVQLNFLDSQRLMLTVESCRPLPNMS